MPPRKRNQTPEPSINEVGSRNLQYLVAKQNAFLPAGFDPLDFNALRLELEHDPEVTIQRTIAPSSFTTFSTASTPLQQILLATMPAQRAERLNRHPQVLIEEDHVLSLSPGPVPALPAAATSFLEPPGAATSWTIRVLGPHDEPVTGAPVYLYGSSYPVEATTDASGDVTLTLQHETDSSLRALFVDAQRQYWNLWVNQPLLVSGQINVVRLESLDSRFPGFPQEPMFGWGQRAMGLDTLPETMDGEGARVAVVDSGAAAKTHPDLQGITAGTDLTQTPPHDQSWSVDTVGHGSHCSGLVASQPGAPGIRGFAPSAELHEVKIFPGGRLSSLLDALDYCIDQEIDVVNMSLGSGQSSELLLQKLNQAKQHGVACVVAAGNSGDGVQFPGTSPDVLTVGAIGKVGEYPDSSFHAQQVWTSDGSTPETGSYFSAKFSCHGPEVDVCAPGVAIVSSVPADGFGAWDGTSMAAPHVSGLAALLIAHHPDFAGPFGARDARRVDRLFELIKRSCAPVDVGDPNRTGAGLPDVTRALRAGSPGSADSGEQTGEQTGAQPGLSTSAPALAALFAQIAAQLQAARLAGTGTQPAASMAAPPPIQMLAQLRDQMAAAGLL